MEALKKAWLVVLTAAVVSVATAGGINWLMHRNDNPPAPLPIPPAPPPSPSKDLPIVLPKVVSAKQGAMFVLEAKTLDKSDVLWVIAPDLKSKVTIEQRANELFCVPSVDSVSFCVGATTIYSGKQVPVVWSTITVGAYVPPDPGPGPKPPVPPTPDVDKDLFDRVGTAWQQEFAPTKATDRKALMSVYEYGALQAKSNLNIGSFGAVFTLMEAEAKARGANGRIMNVQNAIGDWLEKQFGTDDTRILDQAGRDMAVARFTSIVTALGKLQP